MKEAGMPQPPEVGLWIIEDNLNYRQSIAKAVDGFDGIRVKGEFSSMEEAMAALEHQRAPDVLLLDVGLPGASGIEGLPKLRASAAATSVIMLTVFDDDEKIFRALCAGASGYLLKSSGVRDVADAIRQVLEGGAPMHPRVARRVLHLLGSVNSAADSHSYGLTDQEKRVLQLMAEGLSKKEIGSRIHVSAHTVTFHLRKIYEKLHVTTNTGAVAKAIRERLI